MKSKQGPAVKFEMPVGDIHRIFRQLRGCMGYSELLWALCGIFIEAVPAAEAQPNSLRFIASVGHMIGQIERPIATDVWTHMPVNGETRGVIVPAATVDWFLESALEREFESQCAIEISSTSISLEHDKWAVKSRAIGETFPDYRKVIPHDAPSVLSVDADELNGALNLLRNKAGDFLEDNDFLDLRLVIADDRICASLDTKKVEVRCAWQKGQKQTEIGFNYRNLTAIAGRFMTTPDGPGCSLELHLIDPASPMVIKAANQPRAPFYVLMPRRLEAPTHADAGEPANTVH